MIHPSAVVHPGASLGEEVEIGPFCVVGKNVALGARSRLLSHVVVNGHTTIGEDTVVYPFAALGLSSQDRKYQGEVSYTKIGARTTIREFVSIHRGTGEGEVTAVGDDCLLLTYAHVAHNCTIGNHVTMSATAQLAGHVSIGNHATIGGMTGVHQFVRIGDYAMVGAFTRIGRDVPPYFLVADIPAAVHGINSVGLRRAEFASETLIELKECFKLLYRSKLNISQALEAMQQIVKTPEGEHVIAFVKGQSERGIMK